MKGPSFCETCVEPDNQSGASRLIKYNKRSICQDCYSLETHRDYHEFFGSNNLFQGEMQAYLNNRERVLYAYSGGLDSLVTLALLIPECERRGIELTTFTMDHGFKGEQTCTTPMS